MVVVSESEVMVREAPPHAPSARIRSRMTRSINVTAGEGVVVSDGAERALERGMAAYLYSGAVVGIRQTAEVPLSIIIAYPVVLKAP